MSVLRPVFAAAAAAAGVLAVAPAVPAAIAAEVPTYTCEFTEEYPLGSGDQPLFAVEGSAPCSASEGATLNGFYFGPSVVRGYKGPSYSCTNGGFANFPEGVTAFNCTKQ